MFCHKCGANIPAGNAFCTGCGESVQGSQNTGNSTGNSTGNANYNQDFQGTDYTASFDPADIEANKGMALLSYVGILFVIPLFAIPQSKYARFHVNQGIILMLVWVALSVLNLPFQVISAFIHFNPFGFLYIIPFIYMVIGIINALSGKAAELPIIGKLRILSP
ncbi:MAG: hypothetical protein FWH20_10485 [Oscillospiraceae bacterium]|nr:hypothetical protein [Oscillospiraceae bacterium]